MALRDLSLLCPARFYGAAFRNLDEEPSYDTMIIIRLDVRRRTRSVCELAEVNETVTPLAVLRASIRLDTLGVGSAPSWTAGRATSWKLPDDL